MFKLIGVPFFVAAIILLCAQTANAVPAWGQEFDFSQPDGSIVTIRVWGDEFYRRMESVDGYTLVQDQQTRWLCYAMLSADQTELVSSGCAYQGGAMPDAVLRNMQQQTGGKGLQKALKIKPEARKQIVAKRRNALFGDIPVPKEVFGKLSAAGGDASANETYMQAAISGQVVGLTMIIDFPSTPGTITQTTVQNFCNQVGYTGNGNNGSVRDYFYDVSASALTYTNVVTPYIRADNEMSYYDSASDGARTLIKECFQKLIDSGFDISAVTGSDSTILVLNILYAGNWGSNQLWPHRWVISSTYPYSYSYGGYTIKDYQVTGMQSYMKLGTFCHENGHLICGWPDLYDYGYDSAGVGYFCLMASGSYAGSQLNPAVPCAYLRAEQGWDTVTDITNEPAAVLNHQANSNTCYRYSHPTDSKEYFLIESRIRSGRNADYPDEGLAIWHIDEDGDNDNQEMTPTLHYLVSVEQADGAFHLENDINSGGSGDLFHAGYKDTFDDTTLLPDAKWWSGSDSGLLIHGISAVGSTMSFMYGIVADPTPPVASDVNEVTQLDTPVTITLDASDEGLPSPPSALSYIVTSLPSHGWLSEAATPANVITSVPHVLVGNQLRYTPRTDCKHSVNFTYLANDGGTAPEGGNSNEAIVNVSFENSVTLYSATMDTDPNWACDGSWAWGVPAGEGGARGNADPSSAYTGSNVVGYNLSGDYVTNMSATEWATTPAIDCTGVANATLDFYRWLNVDSFGKDDAVVEVSADGANWTVIWQNTLRTTDSSWTLQSFDISSVADDQPTVYIRWGMGPTNNNQNYSGWNIDDVSVTGELQSPPTIAGDFEPDCDVDVDDLMLLVDHWLDTCGDCNGTDLIEDGIINLSDLAALAQNWLPLQDEYIMTFHWPFDTDASDIISGFDGTLVNGAAIDTGDFAVGAGALMLDGVNDYVRISGFKGITGTASRTCCAWVKTSTNVTGNIITWGDFLSGQKWMFRVNSDGTVGQGVWDGYARTTLTVNDNTWHHIAVVMEDNGNPDISQVLFYIDGILQTDTYANNTQTINTASVQDVIIGARVDQNIFFDHFQGQIDDVRIYDRALSQAEIEAIAQ